MVMLLNAKKRFEMFFFITPARSPIHIAQQLVVGNFTWSMDVNDNAVHLMAVLLSSLSSGV